MLASFALFAETNDQVIQQGDVVRAPDELKKFCDMDALLFMPPIPFVSSFHKTQVSRGQEIEIIWLLPVYENEADYALAHGPQSLMMLFAAQGLDLTEPRRDEANTMMAPTDAAEMAKRIGEENAKRPETQAPRTLPPVAKLKSSRRSVGKGSFEVEETGGAVKISRRNKPKKKSAPPAAAPVTREAPPEDDRRGPARRKPITTPIPRRKENVRFDLGSNKPRPEARIPSRAPKKEAPREDPEEAKRKRIAELKKKAKEAAARANARKQGRTEETTGPIDLPPADLTSAQAAAHRRGAPKRAIANLLDDEES